MVIHPYVLINELLFNDFTFPFLIYKETDLSDKIPNFLIPNFLLPNFLIPNIVDVVVRHLIIQTLTM